MYLLTAYETAEPPRASSVSEIVILAGCKRNAGRHQPARLDAQFREFLDDLGPGTDASRTRSLPKELYLISPEFTAEQKLKGTRAGYDCFGIGDMVRELRIDPGPEPEVDATLRPPLKKAAATQAPEPDDGPSHSM